MEQNPKTKDLRSIPNQIKANVSDFILNHVKTN